MAQDDLAHAGRAGPALDALNSPDWWHSRSSDELQAIVLRGVQGGDLFFGAAAEMERRAREIEAARDAQYVERVKTSRRIGWELKLLIVLLGASVVILLVG